MKDAFGFTIEFADEKNEISSFNDFELVEYFLENLISAATGGSFPDDLYKYTRARVLKIKNADSLIPKWVKSKRTSDQFW